MFWPTGKFKEVTIDKLESDLINMITAVKGAHSHSPAWRIEAEFYLHAIFSLVAGWSAPQGPLTALLYSSEDKNVDVEAVEKKIGRLERYANFAESIAPAGVDGGAEFRELLASIQWEAFVASYLAAGLFKTGVDNIKLIEKFSDTRTFKENVASLHEKWPWLI